MKRFLTLGIISLLLTMHIMATDQQKPSQFVATTQDLIAVISSLNLDRAHFLASMPNMEAVDLNQGINGWTPLSSALDKNFQLIADDLIAHGASLEEALKRAIEYDNVAALALLADHSRNEGEPISDKPIDMQVHTSFSYALELGKQDSAVLLYNKYDSLIIDSVRVALEATNSNLITLLHHKQAAETDRSLRTLIQLALARGDTSLLKKIRITLHSETINDYLLDLEELIPEIFSCPSAQAFKENVRQEVTVERAFNTIELDDLEQVKATFALFNGQLTYETFFKHALVHNASDSAEWLATECGATLPFSWYRYAINKDNAALIQKYFARQLASFKRDTYSTDTLKDIRYELETNLLEAIQDLPEGSEVRRSWAAFYHDNVQPVVDSINRLFYYSYE